MKNISSKIWVIKDFYLNFTNMMLSYVGWTLIPGPLKVIFELQIITEYLLCHVKGTADIWRNIEILFNFWLWL